MPPNLLTVQEVAERLGKTEKAVRRMLDRGTLESVRRNNRRMIPESALLPPADQERERERSEIAEKLERRELIERLERRALAEGLAEGKRQIERDAYAKETDLREQIAQSKIEALGLRQEKATLAETVADLGEAVERLEATLLEREKEIKEREQERDALAVELREVKELLDAAIGTLSGRQRRKLGLD